jgi:hypothetical protein
VIPTSEDDGGLAIVIPGLSNVIPGLSNVTPGLANVILWLDPRIARRMLRDSRARTDPPPADPRGEPHAR